MTSSSATLTGSIVALVTPMHDDGSVDYPALRVVAYEDGFADNPPRFVQRIAAVREHPVVQPARYPL